MKKWWILLLAGCSSGPSSYNDFRNQLAARWADYEVACGFIGASQKSTADFPPLSLVEMTISEDVPAAIKAGRLKYDSGHAGSCLDALASAPCDPGGFAQKLNLACHDVLKPGIDPGKPCPGDGECIGQCMLDMTGCGGTCVGWRPAGGPCIPGAFTPADGCDPSAQFCAAMNLSEDGGAGGALICQTLRSHGSTCTSDDQCVFGQICLGTCSDPPQGSTGDICTAPGTLCDVGVFCGVDGKCADQKAAGQPCSSPNDCKKGLACIGLGRDPMAVLVPGTCTTWLDAGAGCTRGNNTIVDGCPQSTFCTNGSCMPNGSVRRLAAGQPCAGQACGDSLWCDGVKCQFISTRNGDCSASANACDVGLTCTGGACTRPGC
jgi:hypothetical protein